MRHTGHAVFAGRVKWPLAVKVPSRECRYLEEEELLTGGKTVSFKGEEDIGTLHCEGVFSSCPVWSNTDLNPLWLASLLHSS